MKFKFPSVQDQSYGASVHYLSPFIALKFLMVTTLTIRALLCLTLALNIENVNVGKGSTIPPLVSM